MGTLSDIRDIARGVLASLGGFGGRMLARLILMLIAGQLYGATALGLLGQVAALTEILAAIAVLGLKRSLLDQLSAVTGGRDHTDRDAETAAAVRGTVKAALAASLMLSALLSLVLGLIWPLLFPEQAMPPLLYLAVPGIVFADVAGTAIRFRRIIKWEVAARCVMEPWTFLIAAAVLYGAGFSETGLLTAYALSALAAAAGIAAGLARAYGVRSLAAARVRPAALYNSLRKSLPVGITDIGVMMFRRADILLLSLFAGHQATGVYYMAQQIVTVPHKVHQLFEPMAAPVLAKLHHQRKRAAIGAQLAGICRWVFTLQLALTVPFAVFGDTLLSLFGDHFSIGMTVLALLLAAELLDGSFALTETPLVFARPGIPLRLVLLTLAVEFAAISLLAPLAGAAGAAAGFLIAMAGLAACRLVMIRRCLNIRIINGAFAVPAALAAAVGLALVASRQLPVLERGDVSGAVILLAIVLFLGLARLLALTPEDRHILRRLKAPASGRP
ncbi:lipopolysaccharide biosynthesis protein [Eilatimonas milleporae]|uniref:O-antigen/teichoic acid export membrane protein n=1 Tax=Eilatimonas milleporae TaxID=911205 RepID=A0A3M0CG00_9PROT|nr:polysaccharide biosynthesis C-terminal domain-containing protein [Eilatimonas milleporae]RMB07747.1 O-antigen/teichoic acid export membrane protein [Eilatimonas milleporae]